MPNIFVNVYFKTACSIPVYVGEREREREEVPACVQGRLAFFLEKKFECRDNNFGTALVLWFYFQISSHNANSRDSGCKPCNPDCGI